MHAMVWLAATLLATSQPGSVGEMSRNEQVYVRQNCVVSLIDHVELPAQEEGLLLKLDVREGDIVKAGQILGQIDDTNAQIAKRAAQFRLAVADEKATNDAEVQVARKIIELAKAEYEESDAINKRSPGSIPETQMRRQRVQWEKAVLDAVAADMNFKIAGIELKIAEVELENVQQEIERRILKAPFDGVIAKRYHQENEWVQPGEPILRVERMDRLRIEGFVENEQYGPEKILGAPVSIIVDLEGTQDVVLDAVINYASTQVEASGDYRVWAEVDNPPGRNGYPWLLRPGTNADMKIQVKLHR